MGFIGMVDDYEEMKKEQEKQEEASVKDIQKNTIAYDGLPDLSEEHLHILRTAILRHDPCVVYMHSDLSFYDDFYNVKEETNVEEDELLTKVKNIRRVYLKYDEYEDAMVLRDDYMERLINKYGGPNLFMMYARAGVVKEWIPPRPSFSKNANEREYNAYLNDGYIEKCKVDDPEALSRELAECGRRRGIDPNNTYSCSRLNTDREISLMGRDKLSYSYDSSVATRYDYENGYIDNTQANDVVGLQALFRGWFNEQEKNAKAKNQKDFFSRTPEAIKARYYGQGLIDTGNMLADAIERGYFQMEDDEEDLDSMVVDAETGKVMTRKELKKREFIRDMKTMGWSDVKLMQHFDVGSKYEIAKIKEERRLRRSSKKKAVGLARELTGSYGDSALDELDALLFNGSPVNYD